MASRFPLCDCSPADDSPLVVVPSIVLGSVSLWACRVCDRLVRRRPPEPPAPRRGRRRGRGAVTRQEGVTADGGS